MEGNKLLKKYLYYFAYPLYIGVNNLIVIVLSGILSLSYRPLVWGHDCSLKDGLFAENAIISLYIFIIFKALLLISAFILQRKFKLARYIGSIIVISYLFDILLMMSYELELLFISKYLLSGTYLIRFSLIQGWGIWITILYISLTFAVILMIPKRIEHLFKAILGGLIIVAFIEFAFYLIH